MAITLISDLTDPLANSYCSLEFAEAHHATRMHNTEWEDADEEDKKKGLIWATRFFETLKWTGDKDPLYCKGPLRFPRVNLVDRDGYLHTDIWTPTDIMMGVSELALFLLREDRFEGFDVVQADTKQTGPIGERRLKYNKLPPAVIDFIGHYMGSMSSISAGVVRT